MHKVEKHLSKHHFYKDWHKDPRLNILGWAMVASFFSLSLNIISYTNEMVDLHDYLSGNVAFAATVQERRAQMQTAAMPQETDRIIVKYKMPAGLSVALERANIEKAQQLKLLSEISQIGAVVYQVDENDTASEVVARMKANHGNKIEYAEVDLKVFPAYTPNDPYMTNATAWHHAKIGSRSAWDISKGDGVTIAILDSGTNCAHADLAPNCVPGWNTNSNTADTSDINGHGTLTAGNAASAGDNAIGGAGVAYNSKIMPVRLSDSTDGSSSCSAIASGITYAADHDAKVASNSYWVVGCTVTNDAAAYMASKGGLYVRAMGNDSALISTANDANIIHVGATDQNDLKTSWSNYGPQIDISAPGIGVYCTTVSGGYGSCWGTSFSVPTVSGTLALMYSVNPLLTSTQAKSILFSTADDLGEPGWDQYYGYGRVNAARAVALAASTTGANIPDTLAPSTPTNLTATNLTATQVTISWSPSTDNVGVTGYDLYRNGTKLTTVAGTMYTNTGLTENATYTYAVAAKDAAGNTSPQSNSVSVTTPTAPFALTSTSIGTKTGTTAVVNASTNKPATIVVKYGLSASALTGTVSGGTTALSTQSVTLTGLKSKTKYFYQVVATSATGEVAYSAVGNFRTGTR